MNKSEFKDHVDFMSRRLADELPDEGASIMVTSDGNGSVYSHVLGTKNDLLTALCNAIEQNTILFELFNTAMKIVSFHKAKDRSLDRLMCELIKDVAKCKSKDESSAEKASQNKD